MSGKQEGPVKEDFRKIKELNEARKAGLIPAERDEEGYIDTGAPSLKHQRHKDEPLDSREHHVRGVLVNGALVTKYRKGACENCGSMTHKVKDCLERPRKIGAKFTSKDIRPDEFVQSAKLNFEGKRDRWAGYDPEDYVSVIESFESVETERKKIREAEMEATLKAKIESGDLGSLDSSSSSSGSDDEDDKDKYAEKVDMPGQKLDTKGRMTVRNLRLREDTAKYLRNLDPSSAYYDPKTRSMRDNPHPEVEDPSMLPFAGDNFVRQSGDTLLIPKLQVFAWQAADRGADINLQANPSQAEKLHREYEAKKTEEAKKREALLLEAYGSGTPTISSKAKDGFVPTEDSIYIEYSKDTGSIKKIRHQ